MHEEIQSIFPNPSNNNPTIEYTIEKQSNINIILSNESGSVIKEYDLGRQSSGTHFFSFETHDLYHKEYILLTFTQENILKL